ncbi:MAG: hypothetical protein QXJ05_06260 [Nitrososphaerota archaeon]
MAARVQSLEEVGERLYRTKLRRLLEKAHHGEYVAIEVESGDYFLGKTMGEALAAAEQKYPHKRFYFIRIGYPAAVSFKNRTSL